MILMGMMRVLSFLCLSLLFCGHPVAAAGTPAFPMERKLSEVSGSDCYHLPFVCDLESNKKAYETISVQASSADGMLKVTIRNTGKKDVVLRSSGVHVRLCRTPFYVIQGKKSVALSLPAKLALAAGEERHVSCPVKDRNDGFVHIGFVSLLVVGERVYDGLPEREVPIQRSSDDNG